MKHHLNFFYMKNRFEIILTIAVGLITAIWKLLFNLFDFLKEHDLKYNFAARRTILSYELSWNVVIALVDITLPILVISMNIKTNDCERYIFNIMKGCGVLKYFTISSIFIYSKKSSSIHSNYMSKLLKTKHKHCDEPGVTYMSKNTVSATMCNKSTLGLMVTMSDDTNDCMESHLNSVSLTTPDLVL